MGKISETQLNALGKRITGLRKEQDLSLSELAANMGISKGNLSDIEAGKRDPRYSTLGAIAKGIGINVTELIGPLEGGARRGRGKRAGRA
jgi:XRE family transcriptional regulator, fatty acid utilization regulator